MLSAVFFEVGYYVEHSLVVKYLARGVPAYFSPITRAVSMKRILFLGLAALAVSSSATAPSIPQICMTPAEIVSGDQGDSQIGSSKLAGVHTKVWQAIRQAQAFIRSCCSYRRTQRFRRTLTVTTSWPPWFLAIGNSVTERILTKAR